MLWEDRVWNSIIRSLEDERAAMYNLRNPPDTRLGLNWLYENALNHLLWKGFVREFGTTAVHQEVVAKGKICDIVLETGDAGIERTLWLELKYIESIKTPEPSSTKRGWNNWASTSKGDYMDRIGEDLARWSVPGTANHYAFRRQVQGLLLVTFWGPHSDNKPQANGEVIPKGTKIEAACKDKGGPSLDKFRIRTWSSKDCSPVRTDVGFEGHDVWVQVDLLLREVE